MKNIGCCFKKVLIMLLLFVCGFSFSQRVYASTFSGTTYDNAQEYNITATKILSESNKQALEFFDMVAKWESNNATETEQYKDLTMYVQKAKERYSFVNTYNTSLSKELQSTYNNYCSFLDNLLTKSTQEFVNNKVIFIDYVESNLSETQSNYLSFKKSGLNAFLNSMIYTTDNKLAVSKILNGNETEREEGINSIKETINSLNNIVQDNNTVYVIRNYAQAYINHYNNLINGDLSDTEYLIGYDRERVSGLIPVGSAFYEMEEFNTYTQLFDQFTDYPTIELSLKLSSKKIKKTVNLICNTSINTNKIQQLKKYHYEFIYQLNDYKKTKDISKVTNAYNEFYTYYKYLNSYYTRINERFSGFKYTDVSSELASLKEHIKCINPNFDSINNLNYTIDTSQDSNSYREFIINGLFKVNIFYIIIGVGIIVLTIILLLILRKKKQNNEYEEDYYMDDDEWQ